MWSTTASSAVRSDGSASSRRWKTSTCSGTGTSRLASAVSRLLLPQPFTPSSPYRRPTLSSMSQSSTSCWPFTCMLNCEILTSSAVGRDASTPVTVRSTSSSIRAPCPLISAAVSSSSLPSFTPDLASSTPPARLAASLARRLAPALCFPAFPPSSVDVTLPWYTRHESVHKSATNPALWDTVSTPPLNLRRASVSAWRVSLSR
mmetsp:Transcript_10642/g.48361  ORF Transcript_10642/g.48361 Transcript_10642/m.48361 type:complete len:204 (+) Transcript_10642:1128-1739(+)